MVSTAGRGCYTAWKRCSFSVEGGMCPEKVREELTVSQLVVIVGICNGQICLTTIEMVQAKNLV